MSCMRRQALLMLVVLAIAATATPVAPLLAADGGKRLALVVGNSAYENVAPLINPANDATDIAQKLKSLGFEVLLATNAGQAKMFALLQDFRNRLTREHVALIFFAGHGVTVNNESFLIPVDAPAEIDLDEKGDPRAEAVHRHLVSMASVLSPLDAAKIGIVFLDACRTNAAQPDLSLRVVSLRTNRAVQILRGTGSMEIKPSPYSAGVFRAYATQLDNVASDGSGTEQSVHEGADQAYRHQGNLDPGADDPGAQVGDGRDREQAGAMGGSGSQRELLLRVAGDDPSTVLARRGTGEIRFFSARRRERPRGAVLPRAATCRRTWAAVSEPACNCRTMPAESEIASPPGQMPRVQDGAIAVAGFEAGQRARVGLQALDHPGADARAARRPAGKPPGSAACAGGLRSRPRSSLGSPATSRRPAPPAAPPAGRTGGLRSCTSERDDVHGSSPISQRTIGAAILPDGRFALKLRAMATLGQCMRPGRARSAGATGAPRSRWWSPPPAR